MRNYSADLYHARFTHKHGDALLKQGLERKTPAVITHLLGDGGVWRDMEGTPVVGVM